MSQSGRLFEAPGPTPEIITLTGDTGGPISPILGNINIIGGPDVNVVGTNFNATLTINVAGINSYTVQTGDDVPTPLVAYGLAVNDAVTITGNLTAATANYSAAGSATFTIGASRQAGGAVLIPGSVLSPAFAEFGPAAIQAGVSGDFLILYVTGIAFTVINWQAIVQINLISV